jgi:hypothetical protein
MYHLSTANAFVIDMKCEVIYGVEIVTIFNSSQIYTYCKISFFIIIVIVITLYDT